MRGQGSWSVPDSESGPDESRVGADTVIAGRYRLVSRADVMVSGQVELWRARDAVLARDVG
jgi:hypothetical protein